MYNLQELSNKVDSLTASLAGVGYNIQNAITSDTKRRLRLQAQSQAVYGMQMCLCVATDDPLARGRIRIYHPVFDEEKTNVKALQWANPISALGGFDDSGCIWPPPAGSRVAVVYQNGNVNDPYYLGTVWDGHRGSSGQHMPYWFNYPYMEEFNCLYEDRRGGYNFDDNTGDQVSPPWNTDSYNKYDWDTTSQFYLNEAERELATFPNYYGMKTPGKLWTKYVDGDPKCNRKGRRLEVATARGGGIIFKDDHLHPMQQFAYDPSASLLSCVDEYPSCSDGAVPQAGRPLNACGFFETTVEDGDTGCGVSEKYSTLSTANSGNPFHKRSEELRIYKGVNTPQNNKCDLPQSGVWIGSPAGAQIIFDDSVNQPFGIPDWDLDFNFGCDNIFKGKSHIKSATGHLLELNDKEEFAEVRGEDNGFYLRTATGNYIRGSDHVVKVGNSCECPPNYAGPLNGLSMGTIASHQFVMSNHKLKKCGETRKEGQVLTLADERGFDGYVLLKTGYGLQILMADKDIQTETQDQFIQLLAPQTDNTERGPHMMVMQEQKSGPGFIILRAGGVLYTNTYDESIEVVGDEEDNPSSKFTFVTDNYLNDSKGYYFNHADNHFFFSENYIFLMAGKDCATEEADQIVSRSTNNAASASASPGACVCHTEDELGPCAYQAITSKDPWACPLTGYIHYGIFLGDDGEPKLDSRSHRVFVSANKPGASSEPDSAGGESLLEE